MKLEAIKHQGMRKDSSEDVTSAQVGPKSWAAEAVAQESGDRKTQVKRYVRLTELLPEIQEKADAKEIAFSPAVELFYLKPEEQKQFLGAMDYARTTPPLSQAQRLRKLSQSGECTQDCMYKVMPEEKKNV